MNESNVTLPSFQYANRKNSRIKESVVTVLNPSTSLREMHEKIMSFYPTDSGKYRTAVNITRASMTSTDYEELVRCHEFIRDDEKDKDIGEISWGVRMARRYYDKLFKEYALFNLSRFLEKKIGNFGIIFVNSKNLIPFEGLRWRYEKEVISGKGQFVCGNLACNSSLDLESYEIPFQYKESGTLRLELVKVRACPSCYQKLHYCKPGKLKRIVKNFSQSPLDDSNFRKRFKPDPIAPEKTSSLISSSDSSKDTGKVLDLHWDNLNSGGSHEVSSSGEDHFANTNFDVENYLGKLLI